MSSEVSSSSRSQESSSSSAHKTPSLAGKLMGRNLVPLDRMQSAIRVFVVLCVASLVATIVLIGLAQARHVHPLIALYTFSGCIGSLIVIKVIDCFQRSYAKKNNIDLDAYYKVMQPTAKKASSE